MFCLNLESTDPYYNLAVDEYLLKNRKEDFLVIGINERSVITGKHQIAHREADTRFVTLNGIPVIRRISGGGTVYHDAGNLNFSFIVKSEYGRQVDFVKYTSPVISFLASLGVDARFEGKNDLKVNGLKISGNAEHVYHDRVLHHGTLLFDSDIQMLRSSIRKDVEKYVSAAVGSNPSSVINIKEILKDHLKDHFNADANISSFRTAMIDWFMKHYEDSEMFRLSDEDKSNIGNLAESKYRTWEWNYAYGPAYQFVNSFDSGGEKYTCRLFVKDGIILDCELKGSGRLRSISQEVKGIRHMVEDLREFFNKKAFFENDTDVFNFF